MRPNEGDVRGTISSKVCVTRQSVIVTKSYILKNFQNDSRMALDKLLRDFEAQMPKEIVLHETVPLESQILQTVKSICWQLAFGEALWGLINSNVVLPESSSLLEIVPTLNWTNVVPGSGGMSSGWRFEEHSISVPAKVRLAPSLGNQAPQPLSDADLYLADIGIPELHTEIEEALKDAVRCFRNELHVPCLAMLAKASEGAWVELGISLLKVDPDSALLKREKRDSVRETLTSADSSVVKKIRTVVELYDRQDVFNEVRKRSGYDNRALKGAAIWADVVRDSRNAIHYGAEPSTQNTYEKVAALLLGAASNLRIIYGIRNAAEEIAAGR